MSERVLGDNAKYETLHIPDAGPEYSGSWRKDLIWRFIAVVFLTHAGVVDAWQEGRDIMVRKHEVDGERKDVLGESEGTDGIEGLVG
jgi:hypothetical protein